MNETIKALVVYRLEQADESLDSAELLLEHGKFRPSVNRAYYGMFYAILALLAQTNQETSKHSWVITLFDRDFIKTGVFDKEFSRWLHEAFDLRQQADYREMFTVSSERAQAILDHARTFVAGIKTQFKGIFSKEDTNSTPQD